MADQERAIEEFVHAKMKSAIDRPADWLTAHPQATAEEAHEEIFQILMGKRDN